MNRVLDLNEDYWNTLEDLGGHYDIVPVPISKEQKDMLEKYLVSIVDDNEEDEEDSGLHYQSMLHCTHWLITIEIPDECVNDPNKDCTWWDFSIRLGLQVDGEWMVWCEDPNDPGSVWFQISYDRKIVHQVRDLALKYISEHGGVYQEKADDSDDYYSVTSYISDYLCDIVEGYWREVDMLD